MKILEIFPSNIYTETSLGLNRNYILSLINTIELFRRGDVNGAEKSNTTFGWQSHSLPHDGLFQILTNEICKSGQNFLNKLQIDYSKIHMQNLWANINYHGDINWPHKHSGDIAGVYYLDVHDNCGDLLLDSYNYDERQKLQKFLKNKHRRCLKPEIDKLILFDSGCIHAVLKNLSNKNRVSVSFNLKINEK